MAEEGQVVGCHSVDHWKEHKAKKLVVVDFTATWCPPCRMIGPIFAELAKKFLNVTFLKVDVDELNAVAQEMNVEAMPTFVFLKDGVEVDRIVGADKVGLEAAIAKHAAEVESIEAEAREVTVMEDGQVIAIDSVDHWKAQIEPSKDSDKLVVVDFTATWCGPCRFISPVFAELANKYPHVIFLKVDVDDLKAVAEEHSVEAMPTFVFLKGGAEVDRIVGADKDGLEAAIAKHAPQAAPVGA